MAPSRAEGARSPAPAKIARPTASEPLPLPRKLIKQIQEHVANSGRSLQRLEICGQIIDNFDDLVEEASSPVSANDMMTMTELTVRTQEDDDLTNLTWLQDKNLLNGMRFQNGGTQTDSRMLQHTTNYYEVPALERREQSPTPAPQTQSPPPPPCKSHPDQQNQHGKPPYSFSCLIFMAIEAAPTRALPVKEIYAWIVKHFPYFRNAPQGWKNSVRHNLSLNKCFKKVDKSPNLGKGSLWTVDPQYKGNLVQAFGRSSVPPLVTTVKVSSVKSTPDPRLFPYLARRLAGSPPPSQVPAMDEYLAAAGVMTMKYGPEVLTKLPPAPLIINQVGAEHSYLTPDSEERKTAEALLNLAGINPESPTNQYESQAGPMRNRSLRKSSKGLR